MKKTLKQVAEFNLAAQGYLKEFPERNKLEYALNKLLPLNYKLFKEYNEAKDNIDLQADKINIKWCSTDKNKNVLRDEHGNYVFDKKGLSSSKEEIFKLNQTWIPKMEEFMSKEVEIETWFLNEEDLPEDLPLTFKDAFTDFVIKAQD